MGADGACWEGQAQCKALIIANFRIRKSVFVKIRIYVKFVIAEFIFHLLFMLTDKTCIYECSCKNVLFWKQYII